VLHASPAWTEQHLESEPQRVADRLIEEFARVAGVELPRPLDLQAHRWLYAIPVEEIPTPCLFDGQLALALAVC
jgi:predicted NAD/FAD-dependent oxidoreductase